MTNLCFQYAEYHETKQKSQTNKDYDKYYLMEEKIIWICFYSTTCWKEQNSHMEVTQVIFKFVKSV